MSPTNQKDSPMFLPFIGIILGSLALIKVGALAAWVSITILALKLAIAVVVLLAGLLAMRYIKRR